MSPGALAGSAKGIAQLQAERRDGLAYARAWRRRMKPVFDALYARERGQA